MGENDEPIMDEPDYEYLALVNELKPVKKLTMNINDLLDKCREEVNNMSDDELQDWLKSMDVK